VIPACWICGLDFILVRSSVANGDVTEPATRRVQDRNAGLIVVVSEKLKGRAMQLPVLARRKEGEWPIRQCCAF